MPWFHVQFIACNALQFLRNNSLQRDGRYSWLQRFRLMNIFRHVGKPAINAQKLQRVARNNAHELNHVITVSCQTLYTLSQRSFVRSFVRLV